MMGEGPFVSWSGRQFRLAIHVPCIPMGVLFLGVLLWVHCCAGVERLTNEWTLSTGTSSDSCPAIAPDGTIYFGTFTGRLWAVDPEGTRKWTFRAGLEIKSSPAIGSDGTIYFGSRDRKCYAVRSDGKKQWEFATGGWVDSSPALGLDGSVYFGSWDKNFYAITAKGTKEWQFATGGPVVSSPAIGQDGTIYFGSHDTHFYALAPDGKKKWDYVTSGPIISSPALGPDDCVYVTSVDGSALALNRDGSLRWRLRTGGMTESSPVIGPDGTIYVGVKNQLWAITPEGNQKWDRNVEDLIQATPIVLSNASICFETGWGVMLNIDPDRNLNWVFDGIGRGAPAVSSTGVLYLNDSIELIALPARYSLAHSPWPKFRGNLRNTGNAKDAEK